MAHTAPALRASELAALKKDPKLLAMLGHGIEKESLRVRPDGALSTRAHPEALGSALTHPNITTDFSEAQLELITGVHGSVEDCLSELDAVHRFVAAQIGSERLWPTSMPCLLGTDDDIPLGRYGSSNIARAKTIYRSGLGHRYGRLMQTISGVHYNFSLPDAYFSARATGASDERARRTAAYFDLIRNFRRYAWLLMYLFGASPAICRSFVKGREHHLEAFDDGSLYLPYGTSLRMGRLGYQSDAQSSLHVSYNSLDEYADTIIEALTRPHPAYQAIGIRGEDGYRQLSDSIIQIENEFYGAIRPKQPVRSGERPLLALKRRGVAYVEVRCLDLNPFEPIGINDSDARFIDTFLLYCLLAESEPDCPEASQIMNDNQQQVVEQGRRPALALETKDGSTPMALIGEQVLEQCQEIAMLQDQAAAAGGSGAPAFQDAVAEARERLADPERTPSARVLEAMRSAQVPFFRFAMNQADAHRETLLANPLPPAQAEQFAARSRESLAEQRAIEAGNELPFEAFLEQYLALPEEALAAAS
ncbi:MAG: glutamate--cysteine ligase [Pseudomonadota bacterium]